MSNSIENNRQQWNRIIGLYRAIVAHNDEHRPMLELIRWLADSEFSSWLAPGNSHLNLHLAATGIYRSGPKTTAHISYCGDRFSIEHRQHETNGDYSIIERNYAADEIKPALESWLRRLQMEAEISRLV